MKSKVKIKVIKKFAVKTCKTPEVTDKKLKQRVA